MLTSTEYIGLIRNCLPHIQKEYGVEALSVFGSVARGENGPDSDVDILVAMPPHITKLQGLKQYLEQKLNTTVDLVRYHAHLSTRFLTQISQDAVKLL